MTLDSSTAQNLVSRSVVAINNAATLPKSSTWTKVSTANGDSFHFYIPANIGKAWDLIGEAAIGLRWKVEKQGRFVCYSCHRRDWSLWTPPIVPTGSWVRVMTPTPSTGGLSTANKKNMRVIDTAYSSATNYGMFSFWVENSDCVEEEGTADIYFLSADSLMPGDIITVNSLAGIGNVGTWTIETLGQDGGAGAEMVDEGWVKVSLPAGVSLTTWTGVSRVDGGINFSEGEPSRLVKRIHSLYDDGNFLHVKVMGTAAEAALVGEAAGSVVSTLDKLNFPTDLVAGQDGYRYNTGLIGEANRVLYGDPGNRLQYPGVVASGSGVDIHGPVIKSIRLGFSIRRRTGVKALDISDRIKSVAAAAVNAVGVGQAIAISKIVAEVSRVNGVVAVAVTYPTYDYANDIISVQAQEKPMVLDLDNDITVSFIGD
jgi:hypothetical protein